MENLALNLGMINHQEGLMCAPSQSKELMKMISGRKIGQTPKGEPTTKRIFELWTNGWQKANRVEMKQKFGF